ncbi:response regulator transcription factor [Planomicrobium sp. CPCC 101079]|uniref:response regulator transcription factor n=1 Tax=Planomicrobium sp. CPCC 101079 TaxID=2599618 RepID=UPI0011B472B2|nr:response regulator transcription factor [Planomicrobium sp. CPCC 101079]TWT13140.1 response regulator transcription factor [Planomicrobium sp. CPCC 101079]
MKILLAEDDEMLGELIVHLLKKKGAKTVDWVTEGEEAYDFALGSFYDVIILDWMMPNGDGVSVCKNLRLSGYSGAVLMLTAKDALMDRVEGLEAGADDYLAKPFEIEELWARLRALSRRTFSPLQEDLMKVNGLEINRTARSVRRGEKEINLTPREFQLLDMLVLNRGAVLTREMIFDRIWGFDTEVAMKTIDATVKLLRKKIDTKEEGSLIETVRGVGYKIEKT